MAPLFFLYQKHQYTKQYPYQALGMILFIPMQKKHYQYIYKYFYIYIYFYTIKYIDNRYKLYIIRFNRKAKTASKVCWPLLESRND